MSIVSFWPRFILALILAAATVSPSHGGTLEGNVTDAGIGVPLLGARVELYRMDLFLYRSTSTDAAGDYSFEDLPTNDYIILTKASGYLTEAYDDVLCHPQAGCPLGSEVTKIPVTAGSTTSGIDIALQRGVRISGRVTDATTGEPLSVLVAYRDPATGFQGSLFSSETGEYSSGLLPPGTYYVRTDGLRYQNELYDDVPCLFRISCDWVDGTPIELAPGESATGIDLALEKLGAIGGTVRQQATGEPIEGARVFARRDSGGPAFQATSDADGNYVVENLPPGNYTAWVVESGYQGELYEEIPCDGCDPSTGTPIAVELNTVTPGIHFTLDQLGSIGGAVFNDRHAVSDARVVIYDSSGTFQRDAFTNRFGRYVVDTLPAGTYFAVVEHDVFVDELYDNMRCEEGCDPTTGTPIEVEVNSVTVDVNFDVGYCTPTATSLCLTGDRFRVEAIWEDFSHDMGMASADTLTTDAGTFWFFNSNNIELVVKVLDICSFPENRFWVFAAGLTNVGVELKVTDELTGEVVTYSNPLGTTYETVIDTQAFDTCDAGASAADAESAVNPELLPVVAPRGLPLDAPAADLPNKGDCVQTDTKLCLNDGRFMAEVTWEASENIGGPARTRSLTDESGYFWFGDAQNVEIVVKVLDACGLPSFQNYWVFGAGLTNFEVTLRITDTESGEVQEYVNPQGRTFETVTDLGNFMTCP